MTAVLMQVALITRAGSLGYMLDCYIASVYAFWESHGAQIAVRSSPNLSILCFALCKKHTAPVWLSCSVL